MRNSRKNPGLGATIAILLAASTQILLPRTAPAADVPAAEARIAAQTWIRSVTADARPDAVVGRFDPHPTQGRTIAYIAQIDGGGYAICSADDRLAPVYLYRPHGEYDPDNPNYRAILEEIAWRLERIETAEATGDPILSDYAETLTSRRADWDALRRGDLPPSFDAEGGNRESLVDPVSMTLNVTDYWHQHSPYNDDCPILTPNTDEHCVVGCVSTAAAQIMYYWKWPSTGVGTGSTIYEYRRRSTWISEPLAADPGIPTDFAERLQWSLIGGSGYLQMKGYWDESIHYPASLISADPAYQTALAALWARMIPGSQVCSADFGATVYNWSLMGDRHEDPPDPGDAEVAELSYQVGVAQVTGYGLWATGSDHPRACAAFRNHFRYDADVYNEPRNASKILTEIRWLRPVQLAGHTADGGGHSWVVCGYNTSPEPDQFLMNMGWGGGSVDWYTIDQMFPLGQDNVLWIAPSGKVRFVGALISGDGSPSHPYLNLTQAAASAPNGSVLIFKAGSINTFAGTSFTLNRPMTLRGYYATIMPQ